MREFTKCALVLDSLWKALNRWMMNNAMDQNLEFFSNNVTNYRI